MSCGCKGRPKPARYQTAEGMEWGPCELHTSDLFGGDHWPLGSRMHETSIPDGEVRRLDITTEVGITLLITVVDGLCLAWFGEGKPAVSEGRAWFHVGVDAPPFQLPLAAGKHIIWFGAGGSTNLDFRVSWLDREDRK